MTFTRELFDRWTITKTRAAVAFSGLALFGGLAAASPAAAVDAELTTDLATAQQVVAQAERQVTADKPAEQAKAPSVEQLMPLGEPAGQSTYEITPERMANAKAIIQAGKELNMPPRAWVIAIATALQESKLENLGHLGERNDHDSLGLFQQRPSSGWGTPEQIMDPNYSAKAFYQALREVDGYETMPLTVAAQTVQVSAFPDHYAQWEKLAAQLVQATYGVGPYAELAARA